MWRFSHSGFIIQNMKDDPRTVSKFFVALKRPIKRDERMFQGRGWKSHPNRRQGGQNFCPIITLTKRILDLFLVSQMQTTHTWEVADPLLKKETLTDLLQPGREPPWPRCRALQDFYPSPSSPPSLPGVSSIRIFTTIVLQIQNHHQNLIISEAELSGRRC